MDTLNPALCWGIEKIHSLARNNYSDEFRRQGRRSVRVHRGATLSGVADDLGDLQRHAGELVRALGTGTAAGSLTAPPNPGRAESPAAKIARLEARVAELEAERKKTETEKSILRQAAKYFAGRRTGEPLQFVADHRDTFEVKRLCGVIEVNRFSF